LAPWSSTPSKPAAFARFVAAPYSPTIVWISGTVSARGVT
jgi:hypothetical protein